MAVFLYALTVLGVNPGPDMVTSQLDMAFMMVWGLAYGNIIATGVCMAITTPIAKLTTIRVHYWVPFALMVILLASYQSTRHWGDLLTLAAFGLLGWTMKRLGWPRPPILIGFVLGTVTERYAWVSVLRYGAGWLTRPLVIIIALLIVLSVVMGLRRHRDRRPQSADVRK